MTFLNSGVNIYEYIVNNNSKTNGKEGKRI